MTMRSAKPPRANPAAVSEDRANVLARCLSLDLEVGRADERIHALAGVRPDTGQSLVIPRVGDNLAPALARLDDLANGADFVLGHNVIGFDLRSPAGSQSLPAVAGPARGGHAPAQSAGLPQEPLSLSGKALPGRIIDTGPSE